MRLKGLSDGRHAAIKYAPGSSSDHFIVVTDLKVGSGNNSLLKNSTVRMILVMIPLIVCQPIRKIAWVEKTYKLPSVKVMKSPIFAGNSTCNL